MNKFSNLAVASVLSVAAAASFSTTAYAWSPKGSISKTVQNVSTNTAAGEMVNAKPGDTLKYTVTVSNIAAPAEKQYNDLAFTVMTDTLPAGVELVDNAGTRTIREDMGTILPGKSVTKTYTVRVTSTTDGAVVENQACFTADSVIKDKPQKGCDSAKFTVDVPETPAPVTPVTPVQPKTPEAPKSSLQQPAMLVETGVSSTVAVYGLLAGAAGYLAHRTYLKRRTV